MTDNREAKLRNALKGKLNPVEKGLLELIKVEVRKERLVLRMPVGVISLENLWEVIRSVACEIGVEVSQAPIYATLEELDEVLGDVEWLWEKWIPKGFITMLAGDPGIGKTMQALDIARIITRGDFWPMSKTKCKAGRVYWIDAESGQQILRERSIHLKVDRSKVNIPIISGDILGQPDFGNEEHRNYIVSEVKALNPEILVLDSLGGSNRRGENKVEDVRPLMEFLAQLARNENMAVLLLHHLNKSTPGESTEVSLYRIRGSTAIPAYCRSILALEKAGEDLRMRIIKSNLARFTEADTITVHAEIDSNDNVTKLNYDSYSAPPKKKTKKEQCADWLMETLRLEEEPYPLQRIKEIGSDIGFSVSTIYAAKKLLGDLIVVTGTGREAFWKLISENDEQTINKIVNGE